MLGKTNKSQKARIEKARKLIEYCLPLARYVDKSGKVTRGYRALAKYIPNRTHGWLGLIMQRRTDVIITDGDMIALKHAKVTLASNEKLHEGIAQHLEKALDHERAMWDEFHQAIAKLSLSK